MKLQNYNKKILEKMLHSIVGKDFLNKTKDPSVKGNNIPWDSIKSKYFYVSMAKGSVKRPHP